MSRQILIVEDDVGIQHLLKKRLGRKGYNTHVAETGKEAIEFLSNQATDLMLVDFKLPDTTAQELIEEIKDQFGFIPFIVTTGQGNERIAVDLMKSGAEDYVIKDDLFWEFIIPSVDRAMERIETQDKLKQTEIAFVESEAKLAQIIDLIPSLVYAMTFDMTIILANQAVAELYGVSKEELIGRKATDLNPSVIRCDEFELQRLKKGDKIFNPEDMVEINGQKINFQSTLLPFLAEGTETQYILGLSVDITRLKWAENEIRELNVGLEKRVEQRTQELRAEQEKLLKLNKSKDDILGIVAHDLRNPLNLIQSTSELIGIEYERKNGSENPKIVTIERACDRMNTLISDLLEVSKLESENYILDLKRVNIVPMITENQIEFQDKIDAKKINFSISVPSDEIYANVNEERFWQIMSNLISNALKFTNEGGNVTVTIESDTDSDDSMILISVQDNGIGIDPDRLSVLFEKFSKAGRKGTKGEVSVGLGMSICKRLVELHQGEIFVESEVQKGTRFTIKLPAAG